MTNQNKLIAQARAMANVLFADRAFAKFQGGALEAVRGSFAMRVAKYAETADTKNYLKLAYKDEGVIVFVRLNAESLIDDIAICNLSWKLDMTGRERLNEKIKRTLNL